MMTPSKRASFHAFTPPPASAAALPITAAAAAPVPAAAQKLPRAINYLAHKLSSSRGGSNSFLGRSLDEKNAPIEKGGSADYTSSSPSLTVKDNNSSGGSLSFLSAPSPSSRLSPVPLSGLMRSVFSRSSHDLSGSPAPLSPPPPLLMGVPAAKSPELALQHQLLLDPGSSSSASPPTNRGSRRLLPDIPRQLVVSQTAAAGAGGAGVATDHLSVCRITQSTGMSHTERMASSRDSLDSGFGCSRSSTFDSPGAAAATLGYAMPSTVIGSGSSSCSRRASCSNSPKQQQHHLSWTKWARSNAGGGSRELPDTPPPPATLQPPPRVILPCDESDLPENSGEGEIARRQSLSGHDYHGTADSGGGYHRLLGAGSAAPGSSSGGSGGGFLTVAEEPSRMRRRSGGGEPFGANSARRLSDNRLSNSSFDGALLSAESSIRHRTLPSPLLSCDNNSGFMQYPRFPTGCSGDGSFSNSAAGGDKEPGGVGNETPRALEVWCHRPNNYKDTKP